MVKSCEVLQAAVSELPRTQWCTGRSTVLSTSAARFECGDGAMQGVRHCWKHTTTCHQASLPAWFLHKRRAGGCQLKGTHQLKALGTCSLSHPQYPATTSSMKPGCCYTHHRHTPLLTDTPDPGNQSTYRCKRAARSSKATLQQAVASLVTTTVSTVAHTTQHCCHCCWNNKLLLIGVHDRRVVIQEVLRQGEGCEVPFLRPTSLPGTAAAAAASSCTRLADCHTKSAASRGRV